MPIYRKWNKSLLNRPDDLAIYIRQEISEPAFFNADQCAIASGKWTRVRVINTIQQTLLYMDVCITIDFEATDPYIIVYPNGALRIENLRDRSLKEIVNDLLTAALRTAAVIGAIGAGLKIDGITDQITKVTEMVAGITGTITDTIKPIIDSYQKSAAWIEKTFHVDKIKRIEAVGRTLSPEYKSFVRSYERELAEISNQLFGNSGQLTIYMKFYEMMLFQKIKASKPIDEDDLVLTGDPGQDAVIIEQHRIENARYETMVQSHARTREIRNKIDSYASNPMAVWSDIYAATFEDMNKYVDRDRIERDQEIIRILGDLADTSKKVNEAIQNIGKFAKILEVDLSLTGDTSLTTLSKHLSSFYDEKIDPTIRAIDTENKKLDREIKALEKLRDDEKTAREKSKLMVTSPEMLQPHKRIEQATHFNDLFDNAIMPIVPDDDVLLHDIEERIEAIYE
jgi:hypothetical protein|tara:strand:- start:3326 stop:4687 length:1362 start_codon:yes stop_codon:yes gene_type:complete